mgnify:CR=1 FL=1
MAKAKKTKNAGVITQIIGAVLDIRFQDGDLPEIYDAIHIPCLLYTSDAADEL